MGNYWLDEVEKDELLREAVGYSNKPPLSSFGYVGYQEIGRKMMAVEPLPEPTAIVFYLRYRYGLTPPTNVGADGEATS